MTAFTPVRQELRRTVAAYDQQAEPDGEHATWHEVYFYKKRDGIPGVEKIREAITEDINQRTAQRILTGLTWNGKPVYMSLENQFDWKNAYDRAVQTDGGNLPVKFKLGEDEEGNAIYHTFTSMNAFSDFQQTCQQHVQTCLHDGWTLKDSIDWQLYALDEKAEKSDISEKE